MTPDANEEIGVSHILVNELPADLGTPDAAARHDVARVFTRRPDPRERKLLEQPAVHARLVEAGSAEQVRVETSRAAAVVAAAARIDFRPHRSTYE